MARAWAAVLGFWFAGCVSTEYTPYKTEYGNGFPRVTNAAILAREGDVEALVGAGGFQIGTMTGYGNAYASFSLVESRVCEDAAERGATHVLFETSWVDRSYTPVTATTECKGNKCYTQTNGGDSVDRARAGYALIRVPPEHWSKLHHTLQPQALPGSQSAASSAKQSELFVPTLPPPAR
jgi:hypothetical protein